MKNELDIPLADLAELMRGVLGKGAPFRFRASGFSMSPFIKDDDIITVAPLSDSPVRFGSPVAFVNPKNRKLAVHRVVGKDNGRFVIKGDNCPGIDGLIAKEDIFGCVQRIERDGMDVYMGMGPERTLVAFLSRSGVLPLLAILWNAAPYSARRFIKRMTIK